MSILRGMPSTRRVVIIKNQGTSGEKRIEIEANIQPKKGFFEVNAPLHEGDVIEVPDPRGGMRHLSVAEVEIWDAGELGHLVATWGKPPQVRRAAVQRLGLEGLHADVLRFASDLFTDGHYASAVFEAFKAIEARVRKMSGSEASGRDLMAKAFGGTRPAINVTLSPGQTGQDEQEGFKLMLMGMMQFVRNPGAHEPTTEIEPQRALEYLALASLVMHRLDRVPATQ